MCNGVWWYLFGFDNHCQHNNLFSDNNRPCFGGARNCVFRPFRSQRDGARQGFVAAEANIYDHLLNLKELRPHPAARLARFRLAMSATDRNCDGDFIEKGARVVVRKVDGQENRRSPGSQLSFLPIARFSDLSHQLRGGKPPLNHDKRNSMRYLLVFLLLIIPLCTGFAASDTAELLPEKSAAGISEQANAWSR